MNKLIQIPNTSSFVQPGDVKRITSGTGCVVVHMVDGWKIQADCYTNQTEKELCKHIGNFVNSALDPIPADKPAATPSIVPAGDMPEEVWMLWEPDFPLVADAGLKSRGRFIMTTDAMTNGCTYSAFFSEDDAKEGATYYQGEFGRHSIPIRIK